MQKKIIFFLNSKNDVIPETCNYLYNKKKSKMDALIEKHKINDTRIEFFSDVDFNIFMIKKASHLLYTQ